MLAVSVGTYIGSTLGQFLFAISVARYTGSALGQRMPGVSVGTCGGSILGQCRLTVRESYVRCVGNQDGITGALCFILQLTDTTA